MLHGFLSASVTKVGQQPKQLAFMKHNLLTDAGRDWMHAQVYTNASAGTRGAGYIASTESSITPAAGNTTLTGEISTNGLARADSTTKTHSAGTNSTTIEHTFTAAGAFTAAPTRSAGYQMAIGGADSSTWGHRTSHK